MKWRKEFDYYAFAEKGNKIKIIEYSEDDKYYRCEILNHFDTFNVGNSEFLIHKELVDDLTNGYWTLTHNKIFSDKECTIQYDTEKLKEIPRV